MKKVKLLHLNNEGQALISLLIFAAILVIVGGAAVAITISNSSATSKLTEGEIAYHIAESGADNAILRLLRDSTYTGETLSVGNGTATITVSGSTTKTITSTGVNGLFVRKVQVVGNQSSNIFTITTWAEID